MENKTLNSQESIELIQRMITATHDKFKRGGGTLLLAGGYATLFFAVLVTLLSHLTTAHSIYYLWWGIPVAVAVAALIVFRRESRRTPQVRTFIDRCVGYVWLTVGSVAILYPLVGFIHPAANFMVVPTEALLMGIGAILTGLIIRFPPITAGGIVALILGFAMFLFDDWYLYLFMAMIVFAIIIPGHILNYKGKCSDR
ncbi:MAG: hypothetical protein LIO68_07725 [Rikenellaceae bacterium]|nr:hypothetical protein [Rikenellaceae bacterium]